MTFLLWLLPSAAVLHIVEEFAFPGGFTAWYRNYKRSEAASFTARYLVIVNILFVVLCVLPFFLAVPNSIALWLSMASVVFFNALFHIRGAIAGNQYVPGLASSIAIYLPLAVYGYWYFLSTHIVPVEQAFASGTVGAGYWLFSALNHKRRARKFRNEAQ